MHCPVCKNKDSKVVDSRIAADGMSIRRRRECEKCSYRYSTLEEVELLDLTVVKRDGKREAYSREKLLKGLKKALEKRPYNEDDLKKIVHRIERDIQKKKSSELSSEQIGDIVMKHLKGFDKVAYIRFASVYRSFEDVQTFEKELRALLKKKKKPVK
ncbi:MAG: transcriptional regulator NrdR [Candidatus Uhrbacteria bacterium]|nr:transcriptional regulator NrdR [Patescibacteria group bacterium]MBU1907388.1 transcriptional regulator NrdR [Patescibacteria group bacterium]